MTTDPSNSAPPRGRNIVICADGTGKSLAGSITNVARLIDLLSLEDRDRQVVVYDAGVGSGGAPTKRFELAHREALSSCALRLLPPPRVSRIPGLAQIHRVVHQGFGVGIRRNVKELYLELSRLYSGPDDPGPDDAVFMFGFSRGAFTVRALAGLLHRCGLPPAGAEDAEARFDRAWELFRPMHPPAGAAVFRQTQRTCRIHFMGLWDTVKSYGGLNPIALPHLRHNPIAAHVRHALALDERRAMFKHTTWGRLESDKRHAMTRVPPRDLDAIATQDISEVWFAGCHSDVGGGSALDGSPAETEPAHPARIALRWMVGEAVNVSPGLLLQSAGTRLLDEADPRGEPKISDSWTGVLRWMEALPRREIDNGGEWPSKEWRIGSDGERVLKNATRGGGGSTGEEEEVYIHETAAPTRRVKVKVPVVSVATMRAPLR